VTGILHAQQRFVLPALAPPLHNIGIIASIFLLVPQYGIYGLAWGVVLGSLLHLGIQIPGLLSSRMRWRPTLGTRQKGMGEMLRLAGPRLITTLAIQASRWIMFNQASYLVTGSISALNYAYLIWQFPETLIGTAIGIVVFPRLAARAAARDLREFNRTARIAILSILALAGPAMLVAIVFPELVVSIVLRGGVFGAESTEIVAEVLRFYALAIVGESLLEVMARMFYAQHDTRTPMLAALGAMALRIALMLGLRDALGAPGLALAYALSVTVESVALWVISRRRFAVAPARQVE
jgi:putative peptidoglycan lipid II flippase